jgi:hypothetical protein
MVRCALVLGLGVLVGCGADGAPGDTGLQGPRGLAGPPGAAGPPGKASELYRPIEWFGCSLSLDLITIVSGNAVSGTDGITETGLGYTLMRYSSGDVETSCTSGLGAASSGSDHKYYPAVTVGARTGGCYAFGVDYPQTTEDLVAGSWEYSLSPQPQAKYLDVSTHWLNGRTFTFGANDCAAFVADSGGAWQDAALADVL